VHNTVQTSSRVSPGSSLAAALLGVLGHPVVHPITWQPSLVLAVEVFPAQFGVLKCSRALPSGQGRQRSYRGRISRSPGAQASGLPTASAYGPSRTARLLTGISEGILALEFEAPKSLFKIILTAHFPAGVQVFPRSSASRSGRVY